MKVKEKKSETATDPSSKINLQGGKKTNSPSPNVADEAGKFK